MGRDIFLNATHIPAPQIEPDEPEQMAEKEEQPESEDSSAQGPDPDAENLVQSAVATLPAELLTLMLRGAEKTRQRQTKSGTSGGLTQDKHRGRPIGTRPGDIKRGHRIRVAPFAAEREAIPSRARQFHCTRFDECPNPAAS